MAYTALARRYRSQSFGDVIGQEPIAQTLRNAIAAGRVHHAYLFTGTRGVGKTSMARLLARALNAPATVADCPEPDDPRQYPAEDVQQRMADAIMRGDDLNVIEIDAASNTGVDNVRELIANAGLAPTDNARFKVYIIDEVHMLSKAAFNALLKVMEEPPSHVKFILCTTESDRVLATIQSRCQRFDFRHIAVGRIAEHLRAVLENEKVEADDAVVFEIARQGNGSMRDALSLLDRLLALGESPLTLAILEQVLGLPDRQLIVDLADAIAAGQTADVLGKADELLRRGISQDQFIAALIDHFRALLVIGACGPTTDVVELAEATREQLAHQAAKFDAPAVVHAIALLENVQRHSKGSSAPRALLDAALARLALAEQFATAASIASGAAPKKKIASAPHAPPSNLSPNRPPNRPPKPRPERSEDADPAPAATASAASPATSITAAPTPPKRDPLGVNPGLWRAAVARGDDEPRWQWLAGLELVRAEDRRVTLRVREGERSRYGFFRSKTESLAEMLSDLAGQTVKVTIEKPDAPAAADKPSTGNGRLTPEQRNAAMKQPLVRELVELFDATVVEVRENGSHHDRPENAE